MERTQRLFIIAVIVLLLHGAEQLLFGIDEYYELKAMIAPYYAWFSDADRATVILVFAVTTFVLLLCCGFMASGVPRVLAMSFFGVEFLIESHHVIKTIVRGAYFPGSVSAIALVILGGLILQTAWLQFGRTEDDVADDSDPQFIGA
jgi:hypothetical protein